MVHDFEYSKTIILSWIWGCCFEFGNVLLGKKSIHSKIFNWYFLKILSIILLITWFFLLFQLIRTVITYFMAFKTLTEWMMHFCNESVIWNRYFSLLQTYYEKKIIEYSVFMCISHTVLSISILHISIYRKYV